MDDEVFEVSRRESGREQSLREIAPACLRLVEHARISELVGESLHAGESHWPASP
jgi:hypothetical protein